MDSISQIRGKYPVIKISPKTKRVEVEGNTKEQNDALNERLQGNAKNINFDNVDFQSKKKAVFGGLPLNVFSCSEELKETGHEVYISMNDYYEKNKSTDDIKKEFRDTFEKVKNHYIDKGFSEGSDEDLKKIIWETYYEYRRTTLAAAKTACQNEGERLYPKTQQHERRYYYNSDFYYMNEDAKTAFAEEAQAIAKEYGLGVVDLPLKAVGLSEHYDNFNTIWSTFNSEVLINNPDIEPPKDFSFFYKNTYEENYYEICLGEEKFRVDSPLEMVEGGITTVDKVFKDIGRGREDMRNIRSYLRNFTLRRAAIADWSSMKY